MTVLLSLFQLAERTRLPQRWLRQEALEGRLPCLRVGRMLRFNLAAVEEALARRAASEHATQSILDGPESVSGRERADGRTEGD
jgi:excisionase family DNA binding protein